MVNRQRQIIELLQHYDAMDNDFWLKNIIGEIAEDYRKELHDKYSYTNRATKAGIREGTGAPKTEQRMEREKVLFQPERVQQKHISRDRQIHA